MFGLVLRGGRMRLLKGRTNVRCDVNEQMKEGVKKER